MELDRVFLNYGDLGKYSAFHFLGSLQKSFDAVVSYLSGECLGAVSPTCSHLSSGITHTRDGFALLKRMDLMLA